MSVLHLADLLRAIMVGSPEGRWVDPWLHSYVYSWSNVTYPTLHLRTQFIIRTINRQSIASMPNDMNSKAPIFNIINFRIIIKSHPKPIHLALEDRETLCVVD